MGKVYTDWRTLPDDPNRVGDADYDPVCVGTVEDFEYYEDMDHCPVVYKVQKRINREYILGDKE